jgi:enoyl-CoA hydratase/carnithine racemase
MSDPILAHCEGAVLTLTFNRLDKKNAITADMYSALANALNVAARDAGVRVVVIQGATAVFTAGNDLFDFLSNPPDTSPEAEPAPVVRFLEALRTFPKPLLAAVAGPAVGIGTTLLMHCDLVYVADNAAFSLPFVNLGLCPEAGSSVLLPALVGWQRAAEKLLFGEAFYADEALEMGLVNRIVPPQELHAVAQAQAARLATRPQSALLATKALMKRSHPALREVMDAEFAQFGQMLRAPACREALDAFQEKRKPDFTGM